jgi:micrococcal nuclease
VDCPNCGALVAGERSPRFCSECGARLRNTRLGLVVAIVVVLAVGGIAATAAVNSTRDRNDTPRTSSALPEASPSPRTTIAPAEATAIAGGPRPPADGLQVEVTRVVDGDTVALFGLEIGKPDGRSASRLARLIGIDTPEVSSGVECYGREASDFTKRSLLGKTVFIGFDAERVDRYGRALVYIWEPEGVFFNARLAAEGFAQQLTIPPNVRYAELFSRLVREAREQNRGLWSGCEVSAPPAASP